MEHVQLGNTKINVSRICFGTLTIGPLQKNLSLDEGVSLALEALDLGINFFDTAEMYQTYPYLKQVIKKSKKPVVIASKSYAYTYDGMIKSVEKARREIDRDYIDIFMLHEQESWLTFKGHYKAWEALQDLKSKGIIKAAGISTHHIKGVKDATKLEGIDVIHPLINYKGVGIVDGTAREMYLAIKNAKVNGLGIYSMKPLGGGTLINNYVQALKYIFSIKEIDSVAIGFQNKYELEANVLIKNGKEISHNLNKILLSSKKRLHIEDWCTGCGKCIKKCSQNALELDEIGKININRQKCILCGYCASECVDFCIKVF